MHNKTSRPKIILDKLEAKGQHEMYSIQYAIQNSKFIKESDYIIKLTGRYFIPEFENKIIEIDGIDFYYQVLVKNGQVVDNLSLINQALKAINNNRDEEKKIYPKKNNDQNIRGALKEAFNNKSYLLLISGFFV